MGRDTEYGRRYELCALPLRKRICLDGRETRLG